MEGVSEDELAPSQGLRAMVAASVATTLVALPVFLLGGLAVLIREDLGFSETQLGAAVTVYFATSTLCSVPAGRSAERFGSFRSTAAGVAMGVAALIATAVFTRSWLALLGWLVLAGVSNAYAQMGSNLSLARHVPLGRQGLAYGIKQAAVPIGTLLAGVSLPVIGLTVGWRWAFGLSALLAVLFVPTAPRDDSPVARRAPGNRLRHGDAATLPLVVVGLGSGLAAASANSFGAFLVESAVSSGVEPARAGVLYATGSALGIAMRIGSGWAADRRTGGYLPIVAAMLALGAGGMALLALGAGAPLVLGTFLGFGAAWSWPGLLNFAIVRLNPHAPAAATGITQTGVFAGGAAGPLIFGVTVERLGYPTAWTTTAMALLVACLLLLTARRLLLADLNDRRERGEIHLPGPVRQPQHPSVGSR
ncbi:MAG: MFS transporter [Nitriliruptorales bacterium]|nr:MFS transporter [Nitriliruptorales bacterium]